MQRALASSATYVDRAVAAFEAMQRRFAAGDGLYYEKHPAEGRWRKRYASQWPLSQALAAALDLYGLSEDYAQAVRECVQGLRYYWDARPAAGLPACRPTTRLRCRRWAREAEATSITTTTPGRDWGSCAPTGCWVSLRRWRRRSWCLPS